MDRMRIMIIGGTTEARILTRALSPFCEIHITAATDYAGHLLEEEALDNIHIYSGRLNKREMAELTTRIKPVFIVDATHPYAKEVSVNVRETGDLLQIPVYRLKRLKEDCGHLLRVSSTSEAADFLARTKGNILLTCGSKEIEHFTKVEDYSKRIFARVLPQEEVLRKCLESGFKPSQLALMQGPFSKEFNMAHLKMTQARYLVTKDSGKEGGFPEKLKAAEALGVMVIVIDREEEEGYTLDALLRLFKNRYKWDIPELHNAESIENEEPQGPVTIGHLRDHFPLFYNVRGKKVKVFGGGKIAERRVKKLKMFSFIIEVIAPEWSPWIQEMADSGEITLTTRKYEPGDCSGADYVLAATNDSDVNNQISRECKAGHIPVNAAHKKEESDFYIPGIVTRGEIVVGITASGMNHELAKRVTRAIGGTLRVMEERGNL